MRNRSLLWSLVVIPALLSGACGEDKTELAAVPTDGQFGALMVSSAGERLLPVVARDASGQPTAVTGALWVDGTGNSVYVELDPATGLPSRTVLGDFVVLFSNWTPDGTTADVARIYGPTGFVEVRRGVRLSEGDAATPGRLSSAATCLPDCPSRERTIAELLKVAGLGLSVGTCGLAAGLTWGAMLLPCSGAVVAAAKLVSAEDSWLNAPLGRAGNLLKGVDILQCLGGDPSGCVSLALDQASGEFEKQASTVEKYDALVRDANDRLMNGELPSGVVSGSPPSCIDRYECTPGSYLPCLQGTRQCGPDCTWPECPRREPAGECPLGADGNSLCAALVATVEAQCSASGGRIISWSPDQAACVQGYECWARTCRCLLSCSASCGNDMPCVEACVTAAGQDVQDQAVECAACPRPEVQGQCQTGG